jgi:hypothetical protein
MSTLNIYDRDKYVRLFNGKQVRYKHVIGRCRCYRHEGFMTAEMLKKHDCIGKECPYLTKHNDSFWSNYTYEPQRTAFGISISLLQKGVYQ